MRQRIKTGDKFGNCTVVEYRSGFSLCRCSCGRSEKPCRNATLSNGTSTGCRQCGLDSCHQKHVGVPTRRVLKDLPFAAYIRLFNKVDHCFKRCLDEQHHQWKNYGGRGITIYPPWVKNKWKFVEYISQLPGADDKSLVLDREDNDGDYEPGNLRFVTHSESSYNRRPFQTNHDVSGRFMTVKQVPLT